MDSKKVTGERSISKLIAHLLMNIVQQNFTATCPIALESANEHFAPPNVAPSGWGFRGLAEFSVFSPHGGR